MFEDVFQDFQGFMAGHVTLALWAVFLAALGESILIVGLFVPGSVVLVAAGALIGAGALPFWPVFALTVAGAFLGDMISFQLGRHYRAEIRALPLVGRYPGLMDRGERFFAAWGTSSVFVGRFIPGVKAVIPGVAGMMGMTPARFVAVDLLAATGFAAVNLLPAIGVGVGLDAIGTANPRLLALGLALLVVLYLAYRLARFAAAWVVPHAIGWLRAASDVATARGLPGAAVVDAVVYNRRGVLAPILWVAVAALAALGFVELSLELTAGSTLAASDQALSNLVQSFRSAPADAIMVAVTMLGDGVVLTAVAVALVAGLAAFREWRVAGAAAAAMGAAMAFVPFVKDTLQRPRPQLLYDGADAFSFPSGHASLSMTVLGVVAVVLASRMRRPLRLTVYALAATLAVLIAFSRIYLAAHWPSDVVAGILFGGAVVSGFALTLHNRRLTIRARWLGAAVAVVFAVAYGANLRSGYAEWTLAYELETTPATLAHGDWVDGGWRRLPSRRIELSGETGEPLAIQTDAGATPVAAALAAASWRVERDPGLGLVAALPATGPLEGRDPLPLFHDGRAPVLTATRPRADGGRLVLRLWPSGYAVGTDRPILLGSVTEERLEPLAFGYSAIEEEDAALDAPALFAAVAGLRILRPAGGAGPLLVTVDPAAGEAGAAAAADAPR